MFRALLADMQVNAQQAPGFHYYLQRHIDLDEGEHGPLSLLMLDEVCAGDPVRIAEAQAAAEQALRAPAALLGRIADSATPTAPPAHRELSWTDSKRLITLNCRRLCRLWPGSDGIAQMGRLSGLPACGIVCAQT